jgi:hypothetical protein
MTSNLKDTERGRWCSPGVTWYEERGTLFLIFGHVCGVRAFYVIIVMAG